MSIYLKVKFMLLIAPKKFMLLSYLTQKKNIT